MDVTYSLSRTAQPTMKRRVDLDGPDFYPTPAWATRALIRNEAFVGDIWEPACGDGAMSEVLAETGCEVSSSDLVDRGYGSVGIDFLTANRRASNIVTNPPYHSAEGFASRGLDQASRKVCLLLRLAFLEGGARHRSLFATTPPTRVWVFSERITFYPKGAPQAGSGTVAYAWFVWDKEALGSTELRWFPAGTKTLNQKSPA
ncbi:class I SAM-dependent methyltransferase [Xanthobacter sp. KR7-65]|uniref:class I SAM-dependent methyltransferase n=1 Tax=Xanthobacter sp. KR7-65 TaxID=3156612 RepID=UPI0032B4DC2B